MTPITRREVYLTAAVSHTDAGGNLPEPVTREEFFLKQLCDKIAALNATSPEDIQTAVTAYLTEHGVTINIRAATDAEMEGAMNNA